MVRYTAAPGLVDAGQLKNSISSGLSLAASESSGIFAACAESVLRERRGVFDHCGMRVLSLQTGQTMLRPSHRASARSGLRHAVQRNFTSSASTSGGNAGAHPAVRSGKFTSLGTGTWRAQEWHSITSSRASVFPWSAVPQMTQKNRIVGMALKLGRDGEKIPSGLTVGSCHPISSGQGETITTTFCGRHPANRSRLREIVDTSVSFFMSNAEPFSRASHNAASSRDIEPAQIQFIAQTFGEFLGDAHPGDESSDARRTEMFRWIHHRLFEDRVSVAMVFAELNSARRQTRIIAVTSGKGGVGKTTFSVNLAVACAQLGRKVLLFDADFGMANVHIFAGVNPSATLLDVVDGRVSLDDVIVPGPCGVQLICGASGIGRMADLDARVLEALGRELLRVASEFDVLIMDTGAGIAPSVTHFLGLAQETVVVATPNLASTLDAYGVIKLAHESRLATRIHVLINLAENETQAARVLERIAGCANRFLNSSLGALGFLERDPSVEQSNQSRRPLALTDPDNANAHRIAAIAARLIGAEKAAAPSADECQQHAAA
jgi:flagellar biosynthesis protein FlhG